MGTIFHNLRLILYTFMKQNITKLDALFMWLKQLKFISVIDMITKITPNFLTKHIIDILNTQAITE